MHPARAGIRGVAEDLRGVDEDLLPVVIPVSGVVLVQRDALPAVVAVVIDDGRHLAHVVRLLDLVHGALLPALHGHVQEDGREQPPAEPEPDKHGGKGEQDALADGLAAGEHHDHHVPQAGDGNGNAEDDLQGGDVRGAADCAGDLPDGGEEHQDAD